MTIETAPALYRESRAREDETASCPAIRSFKTAGQHRLDAGKSKINGLVASSVLVGIGVCATVVGGVNLADQPIRLEYLALVAVTGPLTILFAATANGLLKDVMRRIEGDTEIAFGLKVRANNLQRKVQDLSLRASMKDAAGIEGAVPGEVGKDAPGTIIVPFNKRH